MLDIADIDPTPQILTKGVPRSYTHCVAHSKSIFKNPPTPYSLLRITLIDVSCKTPPGAKIKS